MTLATDLGKLANQIGPKISEEYPPLEAGIAIRAARLCTYHDHMRAAAYMEQPQRGTDLIGLSKQIS